MTITVGFCEVSSLTGVMGLCHNKRWKW